MAERAIKIYEAEAQDLYIRGMSAARGGKQTVAVRLLRQAVRLNPYHEQAWFWLSIVLDDQDDAIYCLRSVLDINPHNQRARDALARLTDAPDHDEPLLQGSGLDDEVTYTRSLQSNLSWWTGWREAKVVWRLVTRTLWLFPVLLIGVTLVLRIVLVLQPLPQFPTYRDFEAPAPTPDILSAFLALEATMPPAPSPSRDEQHVALNHYWSNIKTTRSALQSAVREYRQQTEHSRTTVERAAATRVFAEHLDRAETTLAQLPPPAGTRQAHVAYLDGLVEERQAVQDLLTFYTDGDVKYANSAGVRLQTARIKFGEALSAWNQYARETATSFEDVAGENAR